MWWGFLVFLVSLGEIEEKEQKKEQKEWFSVCPFKMRLFQNSKKKSRKWRIWTNRKELLLWSKRTCFLSSTKCPPNLKMESRTVLKEAPLNRTIIRQRKKKIMLFWFVFDLFIFLLEFMIFMCSMKMALHLWTKESKCGGQTIKNGTVVWLKVTILKITNTLFFTTTISWKYWIWRMKR